MGRCHAESCGTFETMNVEANANHASLQLELMLGAYASTLLHYNRDQPCKVSQLLCQQWWHTGTALPAWAIQISVISIMLFMLQRA